MGLMSYLRSHAGLVIFVIGLAIVAFLMGDAIKMGTPFWARSQSQVGSVNGESIDYQDFNAKVDQTAMMYQQQIGGGDASKLKQYAVQQVWTQFISQEILKQEIEKIGLSVGKDELNDLIFGTHPSMQIIQQFTNPNTGEFDRNFLNNVIEQAKTDPELKQQWEQLLESVKSERLNEKYSNILSHSVYTTSLEAEYDYSARKKQASFKYLLLDYASVSDGEIKLSDSDYKEYYDKYKNSFRNLEEVRSLEYVLVDARPTANDTAMVLSEINQVKANLQSSDNPEQFVLSASETKYPVKYYTKGQLNPELDSTVFGMAAGSTVGPFLTEGVYQVARVIDTKVSPDSIRASHILLNPAAEGGMDNAKIKADSIKMLIDNGANMAELAAMYSMDEGSKVNGGDLGIFGRGRMLPAFEDAVFAAKPNQTIVVQTDRGVHIVHIEKSIGSSKIAKLAIADKFIVAGSATTEAAYTKANTFFALAEKEKFEDAAASKGLKIQKAPRVLAMDNMLNNVETPRELFRWAFKAKKGELADKVYESDQHFFVARVTNFEKTGIQPLDQLKSEIEPAVKNMVKARLLKQKMDNALSGVSSLDQASQKLGKNLLSVDNVVLANPVIPGVALEGSVIGTVFGIQPHKPSKAIEGTQGVYAVEVVSFSNPEVLGGQLLESKKKELTTERTQKAWGEIFNALKNSADIYDNRIKFY